jgi:hypothetical protein
MPEKSWSQILAEHSPELAQLLQEDSQFMSADSALPSWIKYLMAMQMDAIFNKPAGVSFYAKKALELGQQAQPWNNQLVHVRRAPCHGQR